MESPAKRMRILQSVEVDEENVEYIKAKQKQQQKLKSRFESIFEKFGNMNESQSDEIDFKTNKVVVDRGHLRRIKRHVNGKGKTLLDTVVLASGRDFEEDEEEDMSEQDSEDELALPQLVKSKTTGPPEQDTSKRQVESTETNAQQPTSPQPGVPVASTPQIPNTPNPAADLLSSVQLPHTPAGQEAQSAAFYANLLQTINQAVHQFTASLNTPNAPPAFANVAPVPITPITIDDKVTPATDPKWFFPPLSANSRPCPIAQSSPLPSHVAAPAAIETAHTDIIPIDVGEERPAMAPYTRLGQSSPAKPRRSSPRVEIRKRGPQSARKYDFTHEDDVYMSRRKRIDNASWAAIKDGMQKWRGWPMSALQNRWISIKDQNLHLQEPSVTPTGVHVDGSGSAPTQKVYAISKLPHHLPTPSSSEHEEFHQAIAASTYESSQNMPSSSTHYDEDERDLLSLAGSDSDEEQLPTGDDDTIVVASQDMILPSIETRDSIDEDSMLEDLPSTPQTQDFIMTPTRASTVTVKTEPAFSSPLTLRERKRSPPTTVDVVVPEPQDNEDDDVQDDDDSSNIIVAPYQPPSKPSTPPHQSPQQKTTHTTPILRKRRSPSLDLIATSDSDDELAFFRLATTNPLTPNNRKRKHQTVTTTIPATACRSHRTTHKARHVHGSSKTRTSTTIKPASQTGRRAFVKRVKREWTSSKAGATTPAKDTDKDKDRDRESAVAVENKGVRTSFASGGAGLRGYVVISGTRKRKWVDDQGSEDELAMFW